MPRVVSFIVLVAIILLIGLKFFQVMILFIVPLFLAAVLVVIFKPLHQWISERVKGRKRLAAALTTTAIVLIVLLPTVGLAVRAVSEGAELFANLSVNPAPTKNADDLALAVEPAEVEAEENPSEIESLSLFINQLVGEANALLERFNIPYKMKSQEIVREVTDSLGKMVTPIAVGGFRLIVSSLVSLAIMVITTYYFFADGPAMILGLMRLSPLDDKYEQELLDKFSDISRSVVLATLASAIAQGMLAGVGFFFAGIDRVFFLTGLTMFLAMIPFVGSVAVWVPVCAWLHFHDQRTTAAVVLAIYCAGVVSMVDNIIKPYILHGQANLHPLLALLSVIGGVQVLGPIGILVGPMLVAFLQALLNMLNKELGQMGEGPVVALQQAMEPKKPPSPKKRKQ